MLNRPEIKQLFVKQACLERIETHVASVEVLKTTDL
jgi:hypothetical protein